ncbi:CDP-diacylglycerol--glycerol-3-phosphate 3-phosphatidyltransferase [Peptostreptococcus equinus]|uniref:CDP-diacylglycerol--glycerol-3-phosphate 3-phosphatidyltransferase n=1 Tax=Peptostreptococcus equinus TaxID=3003601 RepID=A0ABY7JVB1_9FIRM|nr:CDP-diacylglycerol--glycerol-3-phosphate 3-phosphatidyltransferase [Peptostreptococcus sp. CBA3647]WAW15652.1 CDP-diacylglycerol--glycerol-3-phosphate 3-phosphatidyltransferase [Peptostreptococcus sp. CBA3647]
MNLPNKLTLFRICLVPILVLITYIDFPEKYLVALILFILASVTDFLDGHLARSRNLVTDFGKFMDPLADKILVIATLICLIEAGLVPGWGVTIIIARELAVSILRAIAASNGTVIAAGKSGKLKTITQMFAIIFLLLGAYVDHYIVLMIGSILFYISVVLTIYSGYEYLWANKSVFSDM